jgi:tetratricopeptide (TPR) repeat protein
MEFIAGQSLREALSAERMKLGKIVDIACQIADGLAAAHRAGVVHRDLKPRNIMLTTDGRAKIVDFGVGKTNRPGPGHDEPTLHAGGLTDTLIVVGTAGYMAPEQVSNRPTDFRADQFALGVILYEMLTGRRAFKRNTAVQTLAATVEAEPEPLGELVPDTPIEVVTIVERCLAKDPAHRYASTQDLARDLRDIRPTTGSRTARSTGIRRASPRRLWRWVAAAAAVLVLVATAWILSDRTSAPLKQARALLDRYDKQTNVDRALDVLTPLVAANGRSAAARTMLAEAYQRKFDYVKDPKLADRAGEEAGVALTVNASYAPAHVVLAMINFGQGRYDGALGEAQRAAALDTGNSRAWREVGRVQFALGHRDEAEKAFRKAVSLDPNDWTAHNSLGSLLFSLNRLDEAVAEFERVQALAPDNTRAYNNLGSAYLQQERFDKATEMYERSLSLDKNATAYSNLGTALYQQGKYADAARSFEGAVALPGATLVHWFNLGAACYWVPDLRQRAREAYQTAVKLGEATRAATNRIDVASLAELASGYAVLGLLTAGAEAQAFKTRARTLLPAIEQQKLDANVLATLGTTYEELGDRQKALDWLERAVQAGYSLKRIERSPWLTDLRGDERYTRLRK